MNKQAAFTLIELMITVAIIAILVAIAIPKYQDYIIKTQVTRVIGEVAHLTSNVEHCIAETRLIIGHLNSINFTTTCDPGTTPSNLITTVDLSQTGSLSENSGFAQVSILPDGSASMAARFGANAHTNLLGLGIVWTRSIEGSWRCSMGIITPGIAGVTLAIASPMSGHQVRYAQVVCPAVRI